MTKFSGWAINPAGAADYVFMAVHKERPVKNAELYVRVTVTVDDPDDEPKTQTTVIEMEAG